MAPAATAATTACAAAAMTTNGNALCLHLQQTIAQYFHET
jgi:hypothetical protein